MLVLSRQCNERIIIGDTIVISVMQIKWRRVKFMFQVPNGVPIVRGELPCRVRNEELCSEQGKRLTRMVLTRVQGDTVLIGTDIVVSVQDVRDHFVRIGIAAPAEVPVHREEVYKRILQASSHPEPPPHGCE